MRAMTLGACGVVAAFVALATAAEAQSVDRSKWNLAFSLGGGSAGLHASGLSVDREVGSVFGFRGGYGFRPNMVIGVGAGGWLGEIGSETWNIVVFGPELTCYPSAGNAFLRLTVGVGTQTATVGEATIPGKDDSGPGAIAGLGYELPIVRTVTLTIQGEYGYMNAGSDTWSDMINVHVGFAWYPHSLKAK